MAARRLQVFISLKKRDEFGVRAGTVLAGMGCRPVEGKAAVKPQTGFEQM